MRSSSAAALALGIVLWPAAARADRRAFGFTYEYATAAEDQTEVELATTGTRATWADRAPETYALRLELEHGLTDRWDVSLYQTFEQRSADGPGTDVLRVSEVRLGSRYRLAERGEWPADVLGTAELAREIGASAYAAEVRLVGARDFGLLTVAANAIGTIGFGAEVTDPDLRAGWAAGATYEPAPAWKLGAETWGSVDPDAPRQAESWAGPAIAWIPTVRLWVAASAGFGLTDGSDRFVVRGLVGLSL